MKKLGAVREGVLRADRITWTGHIRDTGALRDFERRIPSLASRSLYFGLANPHCFCSISICFVMRMAFSA